MLVSFINPQGRTNTANLSDEQIASLARLEGYKII